MEINFLRYSKKSHRKVIKIPRESIRLTKLMGIVNILRKFGIRPYVNNKGCNIYLYSNDAVKNYLHIFGSSNSRILSLYNNWRDARAV